MKISLTSIPVGDQAAALEFYSEKLGFVIKTDIPMGEHRWLTLVSPEDPDGVELVLEPNADYPALNALKESLVKDGIPYTAFEVADLDAEISRLTEAGVEFVGEPMEFDGTRVAKFDDTCGNLIQIYQLPAT